MDASMSSFDAFLSHTPRDSTRYSEVCSLMLVDLVAESVDGRGGGGSGYGAEVGEAFFKLRAAHLVTIHKQAHQLAHKAILSIHRPGHDGFSAFRPEREVDSGDAFHRPFPVHPATHEFAGLAFDNGAAACSHVAIAFPTAHRADTRSGATVGILHVRIELQEGIPDGKLVMVVHMFEQR